MNVDDNLLYARDTSAAKKYLHKARMDVKMYCKFEPQTLRCHRQIYVKDKVPELQAGFMDTVGAFTPSPLDGVAVDLSRWDVLHMLARASKQK